MDVSSTLDIDINVLDSGITAGPSAIIPLNVSNDGASQVGVQCNMFCRARDH
jgi:hypothetical protein